LISASKALDVTSSTLVDTNNQPGLLMFAKILPAKLIYLNFEIMGIPPYFMGIMSKAGNRICKKSYPENAINNIA